MDDGHKPIHSNPRWSLEENQSAWTGWAGAALVLTGAIVTASCRQAPQLPWFLYDWFSASTCGTLSDALAACWDFRHQLILLSVFMAMFLVETLVFKVHRRNFDFDRPRAMDSNAIHRVFTRWFAFLSCIFLALFLYVFLGEYKFHQFPVWKLVSGQIPLKDVQPHYYGRYIVFLIVAIPSLALFSLPYFWLVEKFARSNGPIDEFLVLGRCAIQATRTALLPRKKKEFWAAMKNHHVHNLFKGLLVKFFYIPLMTIFCLNNWNSWEHGSHIWFYELPPMVWSDPHSVAWQLRTLHHALISIVIATDVTVALVGYIASLRLLDTHVTSAEPTLLGWMSALLCYPPFNVVLTSLYLEYDSSERWAHILVDSPILSILASLAIICLWLIYAWATLPFGLRFSNLTNRGIVCSGPYKYVRHPAYITKGTLWWIEFLPFIESWPTLIFSSAHLFGINILYMIRAWTEEKHLSNEPHYQEYRKKVRWCFIPGVY